MKRFCFGKHPKKIDRLSRTLQMAKYAITLPDPPESVDNISRVLTNLKSNKVSSIFPMDGNDSYGDCVMAGAAHIITAWNGMIGQKKVSARCAVIRQYKKLTGGGDTGLNELDTLNTWRKNQFFGENILAYVENDIKNQTQLKQSIYLFGGLYLGMNVQENAIADFDAGITWTPGKLTGDGHCVVILGYDKDTVTILTWGGKIKATWDWVWCCMDECYTILPPEAEKQGFEPGFDFEQLQSDLTLVTK